MKSVLFLITLFCVLKVNAQNYLISFAGTGASTTVSTVNVENLTAGTFQTISGSDILRLTVLTDVNSIENKQSSELKIYPNPMTGNSILQIWPADAGIAIITVYDISGKLVSQIQSYLENYLQEFRLSGLNSGFYLINVKGSTYQYSGKVLCNGKTAGIIRMEKINNNQAVAEKISKMDYKGIQATVDMAYTTGDRLKFTGISGNFSTVITNNPSSDKTITFNFIACTDGSNNNYPVVEIGTQVWMAENLKTTKLNDNTAIPLVSDPNIWSGLWAPAYCWYDNDINNKDTYGAIYKWYTIGTGKLCPTGWHVPTDVEWTILTDYLAHVYEGYVNKSKAATSGWAASPLEGTSGNNQVSNNNSGFTAFPGGFRGGSPGIFGHIGYDAAWWSATEEAACCAWGRMLVFNEVGPGRSLGYKEGGNSVRCLKD